MVTVVVINIIIRNRTIGIQKRKVFILMGARVEGFMEGVMF